MDSKEVNPAEIDHPQYVHVLVAPKVSEASSLATYTGESGLKEYVEKRFTIGMEEIRLGPVTT